MVSRGVRGWGDPPELLLLRPLVVGEGVLMCCRLGDHAAAECCSRCRSVGRAIARPTMGGASAREDRHDSGGEVTVRGPLTGPEKTTRR
jgi:hypothetical protein